MELVIPGMALHVLLCLCLVGNIQLSSEEPPTLVTDIQPQVPFTNNFSYRVTNTASGENFTPKNDNQSSDSDTIFINNFSSTNTHSAPGGTTLINNTDSPDSTTPNEMLISNTTDNDSGKTGTFVIEMQSSVTDTTPDSTRLSEIFISTISYIQSEKTATSTSDLPDSTIITNSFRSRTTDTALEETPTVISDTESPGIETTTECKATTSINISEKYEELMNSTKRLDQLFDTTMRSCHDFIKTKSKPLAEFIINLATDYLKISKKFVEGVELQNKIIRCRNSTASEKYGIGNIYAYEQNVEIVEIVSGELGKMMGHETIHIQLQDDHGNEQNVTEEEIVTLLEELLGVVALTQQINKLGPLSTMYFKHYEKTLKVSDLDEAIKTTKETIKIHKDIIRIIKVSKSIKYLYDDEHSSISSLVLKYLSNKSYLEANLKIYEGNLTQESKEHEIYKALIELDEVITPILLGAIFIVVITVNGILLLVFVNHKDMRTGPNVMVINLNICDILGLTVNILLYIFETLSTDWTLGNGMCKFYRFGRYLTFGLSIYSIVAISVQRFIVLTGFFSPSVRCQFFGKFQPLMNVLLVWVLAIALASPRAIKAFADNDVCWSASMEDQLASKFIYMDLAVYFVIPFSIILLTSGISSVLLKSSVKDMPGEAIGKEKAINARVVSANVFLAIIIVFAFFNMPYFTFIVLIEYIGIDAPYMNLKYASFGLYCLMHSSAIFNPIALYIASAKYRKYMNPYICFGYTKKNAGSITSVSSNLKIDTRV